MKVLLISPFRERSVGMDTVRQDVMISEALIILAAVLREAGHIPIVREFTTNSTVLLPDPKQYSRDKVIEIIQKEQIALVGISFLFGGHFPSAHALAKHIKEKAPEVKIITGGIHATTFPVEILTNACEFDYIAIGEGERQLVDLANRMEQGSLGDLTEIKGFAFRDLDGTVKVNEEREFVDVDSLPMKAWDLVDFKDYEIDISNYYNPKGHVIKNIVSVISERGCPLNCRFCDIYLMQGRGSRLRSPAKFVDEIECLVNERSQRYFRFQDDNLLFRKKHVIAVCDEILKRGLDIQFDLAGGYVNGYDDEVVDALVAAGMVSTILNIEHGSEYIRKEIIGKPIKTEKIYAAMESLRRYKINIGTNWIMGFPEDTNETLQETYNLIEDIKPCRANVGNLIPYPKTPIFDQCMRDDLFIEKFDINEFWKTSYFPHQGKAVIKPYHMTLEELDIWWAKFDELRYKYFNYFHDDFKAPGGYIRCEDGLVRSKAKMLT